MPDPKKPDQEGSKEKEVEGTTKRTTRALGDLSDEFTKLSRAFIFAGLESMAVMGDLVRIFVEKTQERNSSEKRDSATSQLLNLPWDMTAATVDTLDQSAGKMAGIVDEFHDRYHKP